MRTTPVFVAGVLAFMSASADTTTPAPDNRLQQALAANSKSFTLSAGRLQGPGADTLTRVLHENQFVLVGEDHGMRESPEFVAALFDLGRPEGYSHLGIEIGPVTAARLETMERAPDAQAQVDAFLHRYTDFTLPFFNWHEESAMLEHVLKGSSAEKDVLWGMDQEFVLSPTYHFQRLVELANTPAAREIAAVYAAASAEGDRKLFVDKNPTAAWMASSTDADMARLVDVYKAEPGSEADSILREVSVSREIYQKIFTGRNYASNEQRDELMKQHFMDYYRAAQKRGERMPKAIFKLGANHVFKGLSLNDTYELGDFIPELVQAEGNQSFNIFLITRKGTANAYRPFGSTEADKTAPYDPRSTDAEASFTDLATFFAAASDTSWTFMDLRPVRQLAHDGKLGKLDPRIKRALFTFDAFVIVPEGHASTLFY